MQSEALASSTVVSVIALFLLIWLLTMFYRSERLTGRAQRAKTLRQSGKEAPGGAAEKESLPLNRRAVSKPLSDRMTYRILKNSRLNVQRILFDLNYLLDEVVSYLGNHYTSQTVELLFDLDRSVPALLLGSPTRLNQVLINLLEEAIVSTVAGTVRLRISVLRQGSESVTLGFEVIDSAETVSQLLLEERFSDPETSEAAEVGAYVARALVEAEGGRFSLKADPENGNRIAFEIPFGVPDAKEAYRYPQPSPAAAETDVLVVDRYPETAELFQAMLQGAVGSVTVMEPAAFPEEADRIKTRYGLILADQALLDGVTVSRLHAAGPSVKVVATGSLLEAAKPTLAVDYYLSKPFTPGHLLEMLVIFYGTAEENVQADAAQAGEDVRLLYGKEEGFISDAEIPVSTNVSRQSFMAFAGSKVMIVEDNPINQKVIMGLLGRSGIHLVLAENGVDALERLETEAPLDLILMDINMPELDGLETTRRIRSNARYNTIPIVAFTGLNLNEQIETMQEVGMNAHMAKPLNIGRIYSIFSRFLKVSGPKEQHDDSV